MDKAKLKKNSIKLLEFLLNPRFLLCFGLGWFVTNGWSYVMMGVGAFFQIGWMMAVAGAYLTFLWLPISPEKVVTLALAIFFLKRLFPGDQKTLAVLLSMRDKIRTTIKKKKAAYKASHKE